MGANDLSLMRVKFETNFRKMNVQSPLDTTMPLTVLKTIFTVKEIIFRLLPRCYAVYFQQYPQYIQQNFFLQFKTKWLKCKQEVPSAHVQKAK